MSRLLQFLAVTVLLYPSSHVLGQSDSALQSKEITLDPIIVDSESLNSRDPGFSFPLKAASSGSLTVPSLASAQERIKEVAQAAVIVPREDHEKAYVLTLKDTLVMVPGVFAEQRFAEEVRLSIRGSGIGRSFHLRGIDLYQDGVPLNSADNGGDFQEIDPLILRYTEVYRGPEAFKFGGSSLGGAINFVTPTGVTSPDRALIRTEVGSFDTYRIHTSGATKGDWGDSYLAATALTSQGFRDQSEQKTGRASGNVGLKISEEAETRFYLTVNHIDQEVPGALKRFDALNNPDQVQPGNLAGAYARDIRSIRLSNTTAIALDSDSKVEFGGFALRKELYHPVFQVIDQESLNAGVFLRGSTEGSVLGLRNEIDSGVNYRRGSTDAKQFINVAGDRGDKTALSGQIATHSDIYVEDRLWLSDEFAVVTGTKLLLDTRDFENKFNRANDADVDYFRFAPKVGALWKYSQDVNIFTNLARSYEVPTFSELVQFPVAGYVPLDPQRAWTLDVGTRGKSGSLSWDLVAYRAWVDGELLNFTVDQAIPANTFNAGRTIHQGIEAGTGLDVVDLLFSSPQRVELDARLAYTLNHFSFENDRQYGGGNLPGIPEHVIRAQLLAKDRSGVFVGPSLDWVPQGSYVDYRNTQRAPAYAVLNLNTGFDLTKDISLFLDARNLTNKRYISNFGSVTDSSVVTDPAVFYPSQPRSVFGGLIVRF